MSRALRRRAAPWEPRLRGCNVWDAVGEAAQPKKLPLAGGETYSVSLAAAAPRGE